MSGFYFSIESLSVHAFAILRDTRIPLLPLPIPSYATILRGGTELLSDTRFVVRIKTRLTCVEDIVRVVAPLKILVPTILLIPVFVIDNRKTLRIIHKSNSHKSMQKERLFNTIS
jgi:hypothetical protein